MATIAAKSPDRAWVGLDWIRVFALGLVTAQHALTLLKLKEWAQLSDRLNVGQLGVALFLGVSGLLASQSRRPANDWLYQRLKRVFPAYWVAILGSFALVWISGHEEISLYQFASQLLGTGLFTHGRELVNEPTWFVSLLLACYLGTYVARVAQAPLLLPACAALLCGGLAAVTDDPLWLWSHAFTYSLLSVLAQLTTTHRRRASFIFGIALVAAAWWQPSYAYTGITLLTVEWALSMTWMPRVIRRMAEYSYEYYLVHGLALIAAIRVFKSRPVLAVAVAVTMAAVAAIVLHYLVDWLVRGLDSRRHISHFPAESLHTSSELREVNSEEPLASGTTPDPTPDMSGKIPTA